ncbi:hypothetical protein QWY90_06170 [Flavobacterium paronense]|uniref:Uncharacterized protein n=1 Tax=Flavobacterium paronense TaxID=1392775 RepID=A0ABV5GB90_9FLAO|nr:hypothetical protein [Flavobacterium paronense]MDN3676892.1 hypothetical protein [Flavobacterium paronense]
MEEEEEEEIDLTRKTQSATPDNTTSEITSEPINETDNLNQEKETMEVHHHAHDPAAPHHKKDWKAYFWEFLMLFLAVFCGFLAEYQLEHKIEKERANELAKNFYEELLNDSITAQIKIKNRSKQEEALKYAALYFKDSTLTNVPKKFALAFEYGISFRSPSQFEPRTIILDQLRNSGSLRYFKNDDFQKLTGDLTVAIRNIADRQDLEGRVRMEHINPIIFNHYDYDFDTAVKQLGPNVFEGVQNYEKSNQVIPFHLNSMDKLDRQHIVNILNFFRGNVVSSTRIIHIQKYIEVNTELLKVLRKEYGIK